MGRVCLQVWSESGSVKDVLFTDARRPSIKSLMFMSHSCAASSSMKPEHTDLVPPGLPAIRSLKQCLTVGVSQRGWGNTPAPAPAHAGLPLIRCCMWATKPENVPLCTEAPATAPWGAFCTELPCKLSFALTSSCVLCRHYVWSVTLTLVWHCGCGAKS